MGRGDGEGRKERRGSCLDLEEEVEGKKKEKNSDMTHQVECLSWLSQLDPTGSNSGPNSVFLNPGLDVLRDAGLIKKLHWLNYFLGGQSHFHFIYIMVERLKRGEM